ncbi:sugar kinase [Alkalihalobacterium alkalinitrilicum]|uniref:sugar kinase n=1 Tax=Alkalihalobacterium alkalinitrilicum TaxID=427920 RepID=UPI0009949EA7|nr:sugar kinase [Alkalihalobacterium alkalinitrilicum]
MRLCKQLKVVTAVTHKGINPEILTLGETMVLFQTVQDSRLQYASSLAKSLAGAESNVSIGLTRLGKRVGWLSRLGNDPFGDYIYSTLLGEGVDLSYVRRDKQYPTGVMFKEIKGAIDPGVYYYRKSSAASVWKSKELSQEMFEGVKTLHLTGITPALSSECKETSFEAIRLAKQAGAMISFDPNMRYKLWSAAEARQTFIELIKLSDIILPGIDEGELITGKQDPDSIAIDILALGAKIVVIKVGPEGSIAYTKEEGNLYKVKAPGFPVHQVVDTVGAGDGFAAGFLSAYLDQENMFDCLQRANAIGAMVTQYRGDWEGLPTLEEVESFISGRVAVSR